MLSLALPRSDSGITLDPFQIIQTLVTVQLVPIGIGMAVRQCSQAGAEHLLKFIPRIGQIGLLAGVSLLLATQATQIISLDFLAYLLLPLLVIASLVIGDWMMIGETVGLRRSLAVSTAIRNIPLALLIANTSFPGTATAPVTLVFSVFTMVLSIVYGKVMILKNKKSKIKILIQ